MQKIKIEKTPLRLAKFNVVQILKSKEEEQRQGDCQI